ncbi:hypothetical protein [Desulfuromonas thiophila]|uniref:Ribbon-helix-helix protein, copG family n=1 Tax=Desulfuromonas thiophila TaxID=57664 RepID=A0A1G7ECU0_9BACT|nr:hypothetical protein [Desulfuromonas thiophila]SDE61468.1 hypothetical protein SAMN05661003_11934 [Desulfuromonas thiophila]
MAHAKKKQIALYVTDEQHEKISKYADKIGISKQKLLENILSNGLDDLAILEKSGILAIGVGIRDLAYKIRHKEIDPASIADKGEQLTK